MHLLNQPRRRHKKSRHGCAECKRRHVKCDEQRPSCSLCASRKWNCSYPAPASSTASTKRKATSSPQPPPAHPTPVSSVGSETYESKSLSPAFSEVHRIPKMQEMRLFHHATMITAPTLSRDPASLYFWQMTLPSFAITHEYVMDGMLAVAALHLAHLEPENRAYWLEVVFSYQNRAITGLRENLAVNTDSPDSIPDSKKEVHFACSLLIILLVTAHPGISQYGEAGNPIREILTIRSVLRGCAILFYQVYHAKVQMNIDPWIHRDRSLGKSQVGEDMQMVQLHSEIITKFQEVGQIVDQTYGLPRAAYQGAYDLLLNAFEKWPGENENVIWPVRISESFITLVEQGDWIARIILLFQGLGLHLFSRKWYALDAGRRLVHGVLDPLEGSIPVEWVDLTDWILRATDI